MEQKKMRREVENISNHYGSLLIKEKGGIYYWAIDVGLIVVWEKIPKSLYDEIVKFHDERL